MTRKPPVGTVVKTNMGCARHGVVISPIPLDKCDDGTYRGPLSPRERREWISVRWHDGTQGYISRVHLEEK